MVILHTRVRRRRRVGSRDIYHSRLRRRANGVIIVRRVCLRVGVLVFLRCHDCLPVFRLLARARTGIGVFFCSMYHVGTARRVFFCRGFTPLVLVVCASGRAGAWLRTGKTEERRGDGSSLWRGGFIGGRVA